MKNVEDIYPLSPLQKGMLFHSLMAPESGMYINQFTCTLSAGFDPGLFRQAWEKLVERHGALRTTFVWDGLDQPLQVVRRSFTLPWQELDWRGLPADEQRRRFEELRQRDRHTSLPLGKVPLMRFSLVRLDGELGFIWTHHHLLLDGWSVPLLIQELGPVYAALQEGREQALPPVRPFSEYIVWLQKQDLSRAEPFWRRELAGHAAANPLGIDRPSAAEGASRYAEHKIWVSREVTAGLQGLAARHKLTLQTVTLGAWAVLLNRYGGEEDVVFGAVVSGRPASLPGVETMVGMFINTLPVRVRVGDAESLSPWLQRLQERQLALHEFEYSPLFQIQRWSEVPAGSPLFETLYVFENYPAAEGGGAPGGLRIGNLRNYETTNYPLTLILLGDDQIPLRLMYDRTRIEDAAVPRLLHHLAALLAGMAERPERLLGTLSLLTAGEALQISAWNETAAAYPLDRPLHAWIEDQADRSPGAVAVVFEGEELTCRELDHRANRLARQLRARGCGPEDRVGVLLERSAELLVALVGILKAGAAYVPLDPEHPADRLAFQERDAGLRVVVTRRDLAGRLPGGERFLFLEPGGPPAGDPVDDGRPAVPVDPDNPAYVLYTSGSTGRPKGAVIPHRAIVNRLLWMQDTLHLTAADRVLQKTPFSFDVSVWELFWPLMAGARLVVARPGSHRDNAYLAGIIARQGITVLHFVPSMLQLFLEEPGIEACRSLRDVVCSGEALPAELARRFTARLGHARLHNLYGPTEAAVDVTSWVCGEGDDRGSIPIGRPIANTRIHLLGPGLLPVPVGVPGELFIAGVNLARGYIAHPGLTAERFLPTPLDGVPGGRVYRTGDLARRRDDGAIEFLGRTDHQVKVRGVRIELGEVETALLGFPGIREAVARIWEREDGHRRLVAYITAQPGASPGPEELAAFLAGRLPEAMVPSLFVALTALPLTSSGKVDRKALPDPDLARVELREPFVPPEGPVETAVAEVWAEVLGVEAVSRNDDFFTLGGDSILSLRVLSRARERGVELSLEQIYRHSTVARLAREATAAGGAREPEAAPFDLLAEADRGRLPAGVEDAYPMTRLQAGMLFHSEYDAASPVYHDISSLHLRAPFDAALLHRAAERVTALHPILRTSFDLTRFSEPLQLVQREAAVDFAVDDLRPLDRAGQREALAAWMEREKGLPLDWRRTPLLRFRFLRRSEDTFQAILSFHHMILDGWSLSTLQADLFRIYLALLQGREPEVAPPPRSFRRFVALEREAIQSAASRDFWARQLADLEVTWLPRRGPVRGSERGPGVHMTTWPPDLSARLTAATRPLSVPLKSALLAAHTWVIAALAGRPDAVTGLWTSGRPEENGADRALGLFLNTLPVRIAAPGGTWNDLLRTAFAAERALLPHRRYPLAELQRQAGGRPLFEPSFNFVHFHVHQGLARHEEIRSLGGEFFERTNFRFLATFSLDPFTSHLQLRLDYDPDLFPAPWIETVAGDYGRTLTALAADPASRYETVPLLADAGRAWAHEPPRPERARPEPAYAPPRSPTEATLADLLARVLGTGPVGLRDSFLTLGGHSLLAVRAMAWINEAFGTALPIRELYERPDLEALAAAVAQARGEPIEPAAGEPVAAEVTDGD